MQNSTVNSTEEFVLLVSKRTCLSLWACSNPIVAPGKELCDILVVCDPHVIIISVKDVILHTEKELAGFERWHRKAVEASVSQIYGAERRLQNMSKIKFRDSSEGLVLPDKAVRKIHRLAVAFGSKGEVPIRAGNFGKGFVHVMNEQSFFMLLSELDTITDLIDYLTAKEEFAKRSTPVVIGSEANLLGLYLSKNRSFSVTADYAVVEDNIWIDLTERPEWKRRKEADEPSYAWDRLIELLADPRAKAIRGPQPELNQLEQALRAMARENRFARRVLGQAVREFLNGANAKKLRSRILLGPSGVIYVLVYFTAVDAIENRTPELALRCVAARKKVGAGTTVVGIGLGEFEPGKGSSSDLVFFEVDDWREFIEQSESALQIADYFSKSVMQKSHYDEYPKGQNT